MASEFLISYMSTRMQSTTLLCKNMILRMKCQSSSVPLVHKKQQFQAIFRRFRILLSNKLEKCLRNSYSELSLDFLSSEQKNHTMLRLTVKDICIVSAYRGTVFAPGPICRRFAISLRMPEVQDALIY